jgi:hypothetical protein
MGGIEMLTAARIDSSRTTTPARPTQVVDVNEGTDRAASMVRAFTPSLCEYVPRHRAEAASTS